MLSGGPTAPRPGANVNAGAEAATTNGFVPLLSLDGAQNFLLFTTEFAIDRATNDLADFRWYAGSDYAGDAQRLAVRIGGEGFASTLAQEPVATGDGGGMSFGTASRPLVTPFADAAGGWRALNFAAGAPLTLGAIRATPMPVGPITGFGIYAELDDEAGKTQERTFVDTFEVTTAVPEPAALAAIAVGIVAAFRRGRR